MTCPGCMVAAAVTGAAALAVLGEVVEAGGYQIPRYVKFFPPVVVALACSFYTYSFFVKQFSVVPGATNVNGAADVDDTTAAKVKFHEPDFAILGAVSSKESQTRNPFFIPGCGVSYTNQKGEAYKHSCTPRMSISNANIKAFEVFVEDKFWRSNNNIVTLSTAGCGAIHCRLHAESEAGEPDNNQSCNNYMNKYAYTDEYNTGAMFCVEGCSWKDSINGVIHDCL